MKVMKLLMSYGVDTRLKNKVTIYAAYIFSKRNHSHEHLLNMVRCSCLVGFRKERLQENLLKMQDTTTLPNSSTVTRPVRTERVPPLHPHLDVPTDYLQSPPASSKASFLFICDFIKVP
jgi:hypothetical protein